MKPTLTFIFDTEELKQSFAAWMCDGGGEQEFMEINPNITFDYWQGGKFLENNVVEVFFVEEE